MFRPKTPTVPAAAANTTANALATTTTSVNVSNAAAPIAGQVLAAVSATQGDWVGPEGIAYTAPGTGAVSTNLGSALDNAPRHVGYYEVLGDGTDEHVKIQAAMNASAGKALLFPKPSVSYNLGSVNITMPTPPVNIICDPDCVFTGTGKMPGNITNYFQVFDSGNYQYSKFTNKTPAGWGNATLNVECETTVDYQGNAVAIYCGTQLPAGTNGYTGFLWAFNPLVTLGPATNFLGNCIVVEVDLNNTCKTGVGWYQVCNGWGTKQIAGGIWLKRMNQYGNFSDMQQGIRIENFVQGMLIDGTDSVAPTNGLTITGMSHNHLVLQSTGSADANKIITLYTAAGAIVFFITKRGGISIGGGNEILKSMSTTSALNFGSIAANTSAESPVTVTGAAVGDEISVTPMFTPPAGISWCGFVSAANTVLVRVANCTTGAIDPDSAGGSWRVSVVQR